MGHGTIFVYSILSGGVVGHGTIFVYSILSVLELSEVLWGMVLYLCTVSCLLQNCLRCCGAWYYICIQYPVCSRTV